MVDIDNEGYRAVIEFDTVPRGIPNVKADVMTTLFRESRFNQHIEKVKKGTKDNLSLIYEARGGWTALVLHPQSEVARAVATAPRETGSASTQNINEDTENVNPKNTKFAKDLSPTNRFLTEDEEKQVNQFPKEIDKLKTAI